MGETDQEEARRSALYLSWAGVMACTFGAFVWSSAGLPARPLIGLAMVNAAGLGLVLMRPRLARWASLALISAESVVALATFWVTAELQAETGRPFSPFNGHKILAALVAILCPSVKLGTFLIALTLVLPIWQTVSWAPAVHAQLPQLEPFQTFSIVATSLVFLYVRRRHGERVAELARLQAETKWFERVAMLGLAIRDRMQALVRELQHGVTKLHDPEPLAPRLERAATRLDHLCSALTPLRAILPEQTAIDTSIDTSLDAIRRTQHDLSGVRPRPALLPRAHARWLEAADARVEARRSAATFGALVLVGGLLSVVGAAETPGYWMLPAILLVIAGPVVLTLVVLLPRLSAQTYYALFAFTAIAGIVAILINNNQMAVRGHFDAFPGIKLGVFIFAFLAPNGVLGAVLIALAIVGPVIETYVFWTADQRNHMPMVEPWATVLVGLTALALLYTHRRHTALIRRLANARADRDGLARIAHMVLAVRDLANTPLQTLSIATELGGAAVNRAVLEGIAVTVTELRELVIALPTLDVALDSRPASLSFDALDDLAREVQRITERPA